MWDKIWGYIKQVISVNRRLDDAEEGLDKLSEKLKEDRQANERRDEEIKSIVQALQRFALEYEHDRKNADAEREMQRLRLENLLLQMGHRLPPGSTTPDSEKEMLRETIEMLRRENEELRKRLEHLEEK